MARPSRIELPGTAYWVSSHGAQGVVTFADDVDRAAVLAVLAQVMQRFDAQVLAYCLLNAHFELLLFTRQANLSRLMRQLNGLYSQHHHRRHGGGSELFHGRFKAALVDREALLLEACRHVELAPVRSGLVATVQGLDRWAWSSYPAHLGLVAAPPWLEVAGLHAHLLGRAATTASDQRQAAARYGKLMAQSVSTDLLSAHQRQQIFIGDAAFAERMQALAARAAKPSRGGGKTWPQWRRDSSSREQAVYRAHVEGGLAMSSLAASLGLSVSRISRLIAVYEQGLLR